MLSEMATGGGGETPQLPCRGLGITNTVSIYDVPDTADIVSETSRRKGDKASRRHAKVLTGISDALQGMMQVHQGMQYGAPSASMYQPQQQYVPIPQHQQNEQLRQFWLQQHREIQEVGTDPAEFKNHQLPLARIKKASQAAQDHFCLISAPSLQAGQPEQSLMAHWLH